jgi:hypothetical protein
MRLLVDFLRVTFVSFEFVFLVSLLSVGRIAPSWYNFIGEALKGQQEVLKWIPCLPIALCAFAVQQAWKLTAPIEGLNRELVDWKGYWRLKLRRNYSICFSVATAALAVSLWVFSPRLDPFWFGLLTITAIGESLINAGCMFFAALTLREILEK